MESNGVVCWFAPEDLEIGAKSRRSIHEAIHAFDKLLIILSNNSVSSQWVEDEVERAMQIESEEDRLLLLPIRIDDAIMNVKLDWPVSIRNTRNIGDFREWHKKDKYEKSLQRLLRDIRKNSELKK